MANFREVLCSCAFVCVLVVLPRGYQASSVGPGNWSSLHSKLIADLELSVVAKLPVWHTSETTAALHVGPTDASSATARGGNIDDSSSSFCVKGIGDCPNVTLVDSPWPFLRDLDLLRLLEDAASGTGAAWDAEKYAKLEHCRLGIRDYLRTLSNFSLRSMQMWDASVRWPRGSLGGELSQLGNFDECLGAGGRYCLPTLRVQLRDFRPKTSQEHTAWRIIKPQTRRLEVARNAMGWAMCVPPSCDAEQLSAMFNPSLSTLAAPFNLNASLSFSPDACQIPHQEDLLGSTTFWNAVWMYVSWLIFCTLVESWSSASSKTSTAGLMIRTFSLRRHWQALFSIEPSKSEDPLERDDIACIHGLRVIGLLLVIIGHRAEALAAGPLTNAGAVEEMFDDLLPFNIVFLNGTLVVDVFFTVSGCVLCWSLLGRLERGRAVSLYQVYAYRYLRLTPAYMFAVAFVALGLPALGSGPLWRSVAQKEAQRCQQTWWTNALYINNIVQQDQPCVDPAWYLACDSQLFLLGPVLVRLLHKNSNTGLRALGLTILAAVIYPGYVTYRLGLDGTIVPDPTNVGHMAETAIHMWVYVSAPCRAGPYFVGIVAAWWMRQRRQRTPLPESKVATVMALLLAVAVIGVGALFYPPLDALTPRYVHIVYAATHRTLFAVSVAWMIIVCASGQLGWLSSALSWRGLRPLSRLSYCIFLSHWPLQLLSVGQQRAPLTFGTAETISLSLPDMVYAILGALVLHLTVEAPVTALCTRRLAVTTPSVREKLCDSKPLKKPASAEVTSNIASRANCQSMVQCDATSVSAGELFNGS